MSRCSTADYCSRATPLTPSRRPGAKVLNLALADVRVLADALERAVRTDSDEPLRDCTKWPWLGYGSAQHFSDPRRPRPSWLRVTRVGRRDRRSQGWQSGR